MTPRTRRWLVILSSIVLVGGVLGLGIVQDARSTSLAECMKAPRECQGIEMFTGYCLVLRVDGSSVHVRSLLGDVELAPWPSDAPLPSPGQHVTAAGTYAGELTIVPHTVAHHPLRRRKELTGITMVGFWLLAGVAWVRHGWVRRGA